MKLWGKYCIDICVTHKQIVHCGQSVWFIWIIKRKGDKLETGKIYLCICNIEKSPAPPALSLSCVCVCVCVCVCYPSMFLTEAHEETLNVISWQMLQWTLSFRTPAAIMAEVSRGEAEKAWLLVLSSHQFSSPSSREAHS
jgi:hypothetical protein